jgi:hypothetical protein
MRTLVAVLIASTACAGGANSTLDVVRGTRADSLTILITATTAPIEMISVVRLQDGGEREMPGRDVWGLAHQGGAAYLLPPSRISYGAVVPGYSGSSSIGLVPGPYEVRLKSGGVVSVSRFEVTNRNRIE